MLFSARFRLCCCLLSTFTIIACQSNTRAQVGAQAQQIQQSLPLPPSFTLIRTKLQSFDFTAGGATCYYGRAYQIVGTDVSAQQATRLYVDLLNHIGWVNEGVYYTDSPVLVKGKHTRINLYSGDPGVDVEDVVNYQQIQAQYHTIITVRLDYMLPQREGC